MKPATWSYAAIAMVLLSWFPPLAILVAGLIVLIPWLKSKKFDFGINNKTTAVTTVRTGRTSPITMIAKMFGLSVGGMCTIAAVLAIGGVVSTPLTSIWLILGAPALAVGVFCAFMWVTQNFIMDAVFRGRDKSYDHFRDTGGDAFFDKLPWPWNSDSEAVRQGGLPEPKYDNPNFVPDPSWDYQCPNCAARLEHTHYACWNCGYNWGKPPWEYKCGACSVRVPEGHRGCWNCGNHGQSSKKSNGSRNRGNRGSKRRGKNDGTAPMN